MFLITSFFISLFKQALTAGPIFAQIHSIKAFKRPEKLNTVTQFSFCLYFETPMVLSGDGVGCGWLKVLSHIPVLLSTTIYDVIYGKISV